MATKQRRRRGEALVRTVKHPQTAETIDVVFSPETLQFSARVDLESFRDLTAEPVIAWAEKKLKERASLTWTPILHIIVHAETNPDSNLTSVGSSQRGAWIGNWKLDQDAERVYDPAEYSLATAACSIDFRRVYIAKASASWRTLSWEKYDKHPDAQDRLLDSKTDYSFPDEFKGNLPYIDHGDDHWDSRAKDDPRRATRAILAYDEATWLKLAQLADVLDKARHTVSDLIGSPDKLAAFASNTFLALPSSEQTKS